MKKLTLTGLAALAMISAAWGRTDPSYINDVVSIFSSAPAPSIDATIFVNNSGFIDDWFGFGLPYATANTLYYTNYGVFSALEGLRLNTFNTHATPTYYSFADTVYNAPGAVINCGGTNNSVYFRRFQQFGTVCLVSATNIINRGVIEVGPNGLLSLQGDNINLFGGLLNMEGFETGDLSGTAGMFDGYWGVGPTPLYNPVSHFTTIGPSSPSHWVTNRDYTVMQTALFLPSANNFVTTITNALNTISDDGTNAEFGIDVSYFIVFLQNGDDASIKHNVYFPGESIVDWFWPSTNIITGLSQTNHLFLIDDLVDVTNLMVVQHGTGPPSTAFGPTYIPTNYSIFRGSALNLTPATNHLTASMIAPNTNFNTGYAAYQAQFDPTTVILFEVAGETYTNMPGRIEVTANNQLDLRSSRIAGLNYLQLASTNHTKMDANTRILATVADFSLAATNGSLTISNLLAPTSPRLTGFIDLFSTSWTNIPPPLTNVVAGKTNIYDYTNNYYVTMVDTHLSSASVSQVRNLSLRATNIVLGVIFNVVSSLSIDASSLTVTTNGPGAPTPSGQLNTPLGLPLGAGTFPHLRTITNNGIINAQDAASFGSPSQPLWDFVNGGSLTAQGVSIWATNFQDTGLIDARAGALNVSASSAVLSNGVLRAQYNDIVLNSGDLFISNQVLNAGRSLTIQATKSLSDGGPASRNFWTVGTLGFSLPIEPPIASLLGTTITNTIPAYDFFVPCQWAGRDLGPVAAGYSNNAALGRLILNGGSPSSFEFTSTTGNNALYVDYLEFRNYMTNFDANTNLANLIIDPGMKIYYAQLIINGVSWAERLNGQNGGGLTWVPTYAGAFSSTNVVYSDGTSNRLNTAQAQSSSVLTPARLALTVTFTNQPAPTVLLSWNSTPLTNKYSLYASSSLLLPIANWQLVTNFSSANPIGTRLTVADTITNSGPRYYRLRSP